MTLNTQDNVDIVDAMKGSVPALADPRGADARRLAWAHGRLRVLREHAAAASHTSGSDANGYTVNGANQTGAASRSRPARARSRRATSSPSRAATACHPETKADTGALQQFV
jgi:hypothetical protein